ncbi:MAG: PTS IIA-like nitrogen regulatory protein PtsN [Porticoccaceae bacterium]|nr:PTS IIA-like nitrogen regulatory protein PtsN [Porticoccaceae bacterium]
MKISDVLTPEMARCDLTGSSKKKVLENLAELIAEQMGADGDQADALFQGMIARERLGSTGIGEGVAIPHCRVSGLKRICGCLIKLDRSIEFDALDDKPVDLIFALVVPEEQNDEHLETLARVAAVLQQDSARERLRACSSSRQLFDTAIQIERAS